MRFCALVACLWIAGCDREEAHSHDHDEHGHEEEGPEPLAITRWTDTHELFVEFPPPLAGKPVAYHAHVTKLDGFKALTEGTFRVRYKSGSSVAAEASIDGVKRAGIFTPEGVAPAVGEYQLEMEVIHDGKSDVFDCGTVAVTDALPAPEAEAPSSAITLRKEAQWKIPFSTAWAKERPVAKEIELPATVELAGTDQLVVGAPTGGRFFHNPKLALAEGRRIRKGDVIGNLVPTVAGDDYSRLLLAVEESRLDKEQVEREIRRVEPLVQQDLLPARRLTDLKNQLDNAEARLSSAQGRIGRVVGQGGAGGLPIKSSIEGVVSQVLVPNGEPVEGGAPLVRIGGTDSLWLRSRFVARPASAFRDAHPTGVRLPNGERFDLEKHGARLLSPLPVIDPGSRVATWVVELPPLETPSLQLGTSLVLMLRVGKPRTVLAVPRQAVVEINTRPYVFVQADGEHFDKRAVALGTADGSFVEIVSGVAKGERIVDKGGFDIHLASLMGTVESHRH
jgi:RND family efflux transporter MFP subunit